MISIIALELLFKEMELGIQFNGLLNEEEKLLLVLKSTGYG